MLENSSKTTFTMSRKNGETTLSVAINNGSDEEKNINMVVKDSANGNVLPSVIDGTAIDNGVTLEPKAIKNMVIDTTNAIGQILVEMAGAGRMAMRQKSSSSGGKTSNIIELILK